eukprot:11823989-Karenia_brevis.AAC.1
MAPSKQYTCAKHSLGYMADLHAGLQSLTKLKDLKLQQKETHIESLRQALQQQEQAYQQELDQLDQQVAMVKEQIQTMQAQTDKLNGRGAISPASTTPSPATPPVTPVIQPATLQEFTKRLTQQVFPDKATDTQTLDGFSQVVSNLFSQLGLIHHQTNPSSSTSAAGDSSMDQSLQSSASKRELSPTAASEELHKHPKETKTA